MIVNNIEKLTLNNGTKATSSIQSDYIDNELYEDALNDIKDLKDAINDKSENKDTPFYNKLGQDLFNSLYKVSPKLYDKGNVRDSLSMEYDIVSNIVNGKSFNALRKSTAGDIFASTYALSAFLKKANTIIDNWACANEENQKVMNQINDVIDKQNALDNLKQALENDPHNEQIKYELEKAEKEVNEANKQLNNQANQNNINDLANNINDAANTAKEDVQGLNNSLNCFFTDDESGELCSMSYKDRILLSNMLKHNSVLKDIAKHLGKMKKIISDIQKKDSEVGHEINDITLGNKLNKILSSEKILLTEPDLENQFYKKYANKTLMQRKTKGTQEMQGPVIVCIDDSGSMEGESDYWAKAIAIAMLQLAIKQNRNYRCIIFDSKVNKVYDFDKKNFTPTKVFELASFFNGGGTNFTPPLAKALESIEDSRYKKADVLFLTDGSSDVKDSFLSKFNQAKVDKDFYVQGIMVGGYSSGNMSKFCDKITTFKDLNKGDQLVNIFANVKNNERVDNDDKEA